MKKILSIVALLFILLQGGAQTFRNVSSISETVNDSIVSNRALKANIFNKIFNGITKFLPDIIDDTADVTTPVHGMQRYQEKDGRTYTYDTIGLSRWILTSDSHPQSTVTYNNFKKDSILFFKTDLTQTLSTSGWTKASNFNSFATQTLVSGGVQIASSHTAIGTDWIYSPWPSMADNTTIEMTFSVDAIGVSNPVIGLIRNALSGTTVGGSLYLALDQINLNGATTSFTHINVHDILRMSLSMDYMTFKLDVYNITQNKFDTYTFAGSNYVYGAASEPGIYITNSTITVKEFKYYSRNYNPDLMLIGDSRFLQAGGSSPLASYDSTLSGRLQTRTNLKISSFSKSGVTLQQFLLCIPEVKKLKPAKALFDLGTVNIFNGDNTATWGPYYIAAVDSLLNMGVKLTLARDFPARTVETAPIGRFIDSVYSNSNNVTIIDLYATTPLYSSGGTFHQDDSYFESDIYGHPNNAGAKALADYIAPRVKDFDKYNIEGAMDMIRNFRGDNQVLIYKRINDSSGYWRSYILGSGLTITGDSLIGTGTGGAAVNWGDILGTLSDQTDLQSALNAKASLTGTETLTNKRITARIGTTTSSSTITPNGDSHDAYTVTALATNPTFAAPSGTPTDGQILAIRIKDNGTSRTLTWNSIYRAGTDISLPTATTISKTMYLQFSYNAADSKWDFIGLTSGF